MVDYFTELCQIKECLLTEGDIDIGQGATKTPNKGSLGQQGFGLFAKNKKQKENKNRI